MAGPTKTVFGVEQYCAKSGLRRVVLLFAPGAKTKPPAKELWDATSGYLYTRSLRHRLASSQRLKISKIPIDGLLSVQSRESRPVPPVPDR